MKSIANCAYCHKQPEQVQGVSWAYQDALEMPDFYM